MSPQGSSCKHILLGKQIISDQVFRVHTRLIWPQVLIPATILRFGVTGIVFVRTESRNGKKSCGLSLQRLDYATKLLLPFGLQRCWLTTVKVSCFEILQTLIIKRFKLRKPSEHDLIRRSHCFDTVWWKWRIGSATNQQKWEAHSNSWFVLHPLIQVYSSRI